MRTDWKRMPVALSFDTEEFDLPEEYGVELDAGKQIGATTEGLGRLLGLLDETGIRATFFCTANYAMQQPELIRRIAERGHEVASHAFHHSRFETVDLLQSRLALDRIAGVKVRGFRAPRMGTIPPEEIAEAGYDWDSSLNPCLIPGRYNHFSAPRSPFAEPCGLVEIPASVATRLRLPLFWLALHNLPLPLYLRLCESTLRSHGLLNVYFHPWEFSDALRNPDYRIPGFITRNSGMQLLSRIGSVIGRFRERGAAFVTLSEVADDFLSGTGRP